MAAAEPGMEEHICVSTGTSKADAEKLDQVLQACPSLRFICIDVANGYSEHFVSYVKRTRDAFPDKIILAGKLLLVACLYNYMHG